MCQSGCNTPASPGSGSGSTQPVSGSSAACSDCTTRVFPPTPVNSRTSQTISNAPPAYSAWNGTYSWDSKFTVLADRPGCRILVTVKIKVTGAITDAQKQAWKLACESKWNGKVKLVCTDPACPQACTSGYPVVFVLEYVTSGEHYTVTANSPTATTGGRSGLGGTTSMTGWGVDDTVDITHEFGHMLGNVDEYFTTNGVDYTSGGTLTGFRLSGAGIMNNPANDPRSANYTLIKQQAQSAMGCSCTIQNA